MQPSENRDNRFPFFSTVFTYTVCTQLNPRPSPAQPPAFPSSTPSPPTLPSSTLSPPQLNWAPALPSSTPSFFGYVLRARLANLQFLKTAFFFNEVQPSENRDNRFPFFFTVFMYTVYTQLHPQPSPAQPPAFPSSTPSPPELNPQPSTAQPPALPISTPSPPQLNFQPSHVRKRRLLELYATPGLRHAPIVKLYHELWHASNYGMHRLMASTSFVDINC